MNVYQKLNAARHEFHGLQLTKTGHNKFAGYFYFELGDFLVPALNVFNEHGLCGLVSFGKEEATMQVVNIDKPDEVITFTSPMAEANLKGCHPIQNVGAVETYSRRYLWCAALEIVEHDAMDYSKPKRPGEVQKSGPTTGIGDDLPQDWKDYLAGLAAEVTDYVSQGLVKEALDAVNAANLEDDQHVYLSRQLSAPTRSALKKAKEEK